MKKTRLLCLFTTLLVCFCLTFMAFAGGESKESATGKEEEKELEEIADKYNFNLDSIKSANIDWRQFEGETIRVALLGHPIQRAAEPLIPIFEGLTGIDVEIDTFSYNELFDRTLMDLRSKTGQFDAFFLHLYFIPEWAGNGWLENMFDFMNDSKLTDADWYDFYDHYPAIIEFCKAKEPKQPIPWGTDENLYALPLSAEPVILMYRKDLFDKYNLKVPTTWEEAYETAQKLMIDEDNDGEIDIYGFQFRWLRGIGQNTSQWAHMFMSYGGRWFDENWNPQLNTKAAIDATEMFVKVGQAAGPPAMQSYGWTECLANIGEGKVAMWHDNSVGMSTLEDPEISKVVGKMGYAPALAGPAGANTGTWPWGIGLNAFSKKKEATWLFLMWITSKETALAKLMEVGSPRESVVNSDEYKNFYPDDWVDSFNIGMKSSVTLMAPIMPETIPLVDVLAIKLNEATQGMKTAEQAMKEANEEWRKILQEAGYYK